MAPVSDALKVLGQIASTNTGVPANLYTLYTVPSGSQTTVSSLVVCNTGSGTETYDVAIRVKGGPLATEQYICKARSISNHTTAALVVGITLSDGDIVSVTASDDGVAFNLFGVETS